MWNFLFEKLLPLLLIIFLIIMIIGFGTLTFIGIKNINKQDYIQNLEEKLNIYERSYEEFCLEDSIKQSDVYGQ